MTRDISIMGVPRSLTGDAEDPEMIGYPPSFMTRRYETMEYWRAMVPREPGRTLQSGTFLQDKHIYYPASLTAYRKIRPVGLGYMSEQFGLHFPGIGFFDDEQATLSYEAARHALHLELDGATDVTKCVSLLRAADLEDAAERIANLKILLDEDPGSDPLEANSVRAAARFLMGEHLPTNPEITASDDGLVYLSWKFGRKGALEMRFMQSELVAFAATLYDSDSRRYSVSGTMAPDDAVMSAKPIYEKLLRL